RPQGQADKLDIRRLDVAQALVTRDGKPLAWCAVPTTDHDITALGVTISAYSAWITADTVALAGATRLKLESGPDWEFASDGPIGLCLDLVTGKLIASADGPGTSPVTLQVQIGTASRLLTVGAAPVTVDLPIEACRKLSQIL